MGAESPPSFDRYPGLQGREPEARALAEELRRLIRLSVSTAPPAEEAAALVAQLAAVADRLETHLPAIPLPRFMGPAEDGAPAGAPAGAPFQGTMPFDLVVGGFNPLALPVRLALEPPRALGYATFTTAYEGAPGCVHGGALAATFDIVFTAANAIAEATGPTVRLDVRYRRPTLVGEEAVFEAWVTDVTARRVFSKGRIVQGGTVTVEAEGEFAILDPDRIAQMASGRRTAFDRSTPETSGTD
jgi:acyl-coenzyme A thioesterase PaaI-like protein